MTNNFMSHKSLLDKYENEFNVFTWNEKTRTVGQYQEFVKKILIRYDKELRRELLDKIKDLLK